MALKKLVRSLRKRVGTRQTYRSTRSWLISLYDWFLRHVRWPPLPARGRLVTIRVRRSTHPFYARVGETDFAVIDEVYGQGEYDGVLGADLGPVKQIVDLGANIGATVRLWLEHYPKARILAVEPNHANCTICRRNIDATPEAGRVRLVHGCVSAADGAAYVDSSWGFWACRTSTRSRSGLEPVHAYAMPTLLSDHGAGLPIDLLKVDIEGAERDLFAGCGDWLHQVRNIVIELHHPYRVADFLDDIGNARGCYDVTTLHSGTSLTVLLLRSRHQNSPIVTARRSPTTLRH